MFIENKQIIQKLKYNELPDVIKNAKKAKIIAKTISPMVSAAIILFINGVV